ncbi:MAG: type I secretion protein [Rhodospirillaceae bacterium]|nr:MAG: type I secretion protein [Rhodospirillaceae bacterium]
MSKYDAITPIIGTDQPDTLTGGKGSEVISGKGAEDTLTGNNGNDFMWGGSGNDLIFGNFGSDKLYGGGGPSYLSLNALTMAVNYGASITFEGESAGYRNTLGWYKIDPDTQAIQNVEIIWPNASLKGSGGDLIGGVSQENLNIDAQDQIGFFIIANGYDYNNKFFKTWNGKGEFTFQNDDGDQATVNTTNPTLIHTANNGSQTTLLQHTYHTAGFGDNVNLNPDGIDHTVGLLRTDDGLLRLGFEDLYNGGDQDFDDAVFTIDIGFINAKVLSGYTYEPVTGEFILLQNNSTTPPPIPNSEDDVIYGGRGHDEIHGRSGNDQLYGEQGNDTIYGGSGSDVIYGFQGRDIIFGGSGDDLIFGETGIDIIDGGKGNDQIYGGNGHDILNGRSGDDIIYGGKGHDEIKGTSGADILFGETGHDLLFGGSGDDVLIGGKGNDSLNGGSGEDLISFVNSAKRVIVELNEKTARGEGLDTITGVENVLGSAFGDKLYGDHRANDLSGAGGDDRLYGRKGDDELYGGAGHDFLDGGSGNDQLFGGVGNDTLKGYNGSDTLSGGEGNDIFIYRSISEGEDVITDFSIGEDLLDIASLLAELGAVSGHDPFGDYVQAFSNETGGTTLKIDQNGGGDSWTITLATLEDVDYTLLTVDNFIIT